MYHDPMDIFEELMRAYGAGMGPRGGEMPITVSSDALLGFLPLQICFFANEPLPRPSDSPRFAPLLFCSSIECG